MDMPHCNYFTSSFTPYSLPVSNQECKVVLVQGNTTVAEYYASVYNWYIINRVLILHQKSDITDKFTQDVFISNMKRYNDVQHIVAVERHSPHDYIKK